MWKLIVAVAVSAVILWVTWRALRDRRSHGLFRFFAWESILLLILLNLDHWFDDPFSLLHILAWLMLLASLFLVIHGFYLLGVAGKPTGNIEDTTRLVWVGAYNYIRHPLYSSLLWLAWGTFLKEPSLVGSSLVLVATASLIATAKVEEAQNLAKFGAEYAAYIKTTKMFIPFLL